MKRTASLLTFTVMLLVLFLLVASVPSLKAVTEAQKVQWEKTYGYYQGISIVEITDEGYEGLLIGAQKGDEAIYLGHMNYNYTNKRNVLIKTDMGGHVHWIKNLPYEVSKMIPAKEGGFTIAGYGTSRSHTGLEVVLEKIDVTGNDEWTMTYAQGGTNAHIRFLIQAQDGGYVLGGSINLQPNTESPDKAWILKTDSAGNLQWNNTYGGISDDPPNRILSVEQRSDGGFICVGNVDGASLVRIDASGNNIQFIETSEEISFNSVVRTNDGGYFFVGNEQGQDSAYVMETDSNLKVLWDRTYSERYNFLALKGSSGDGYLLYSNGYLMKIDSSGDVEWSKYYESKYYGSSTRSLIQTEDTGFAFTGSAYNRGQATRYIWAGKTAPEPISQQTEPPPLEPFPTTLIVIAVAIVSVMCIGLLVYFKKRKH